MKKIITFLKARPAINVRALEREAGIPKNTLSNAVSGVLGKVFPEKHTWALVRALCAYGLELNGQRFTYDETTDIFFIESPTGEEVKSEDKGDHFVYFVPVYRDIVSDEIELKEYLK